MMFVVVVVAILILFMAVMIGMLFAMWFRQVCVRSAPPSCVSAVSAVPAPIAPATSPAPPLVSLCPKGYVCFKQQDHTSTSERDYRVLEDPLYPPLNRTDRLTYETRVRKLSVRDPSSFDTYRLVGYLTCKDTSQKDAGGNSWKLMARQKDRNEAEFYLIPTNNNFDVKIPITPDTLARGQSRLRDVYSIPSQLMFSSPLLNTVPYDFIELPKSSLTDMSYT